MTDLAEALEAALSGESTNQLEKQMRAAMQGLDGPAPIAATTTPSNPSYGLNSSQLTDELARAFGPATNPTTSNKEIPNG